MAEENTPAPQPNTQPAPQTSQTSTAQTSKPPKNKTCTVLIIVLLIIAFFLALGGLWLYQFYNQNFKTEKKAKPQSVKINATATPTPQAGNWTLNVSAPSRTTGIQTSLTTTLLGSIKFKMPSGPGQKVTAVGTFTDEGGGTVGASTSTTKVTGNINFSGEIINNKLHFTVTYVSVDCTTVLTTPLGTSTSKVCGAAQSPHTVDIDIQDNAGAVKNLSERRGEYNITIIESWNLQKATD